jgi:hypothetical protein
MSTFTTEDRIEAEKVLLQKSKVFEPIPFAGLIDITDEDFEANLSYYAIKIDHPSTDPKSS